MIFLDAQIFLKDFWKVRDFRKESDFYTVDHVRRVEFLSYEKIRYSQSATIFFRTMASSQHTLSLFMVAFVREEIALFP